MTYDEVAEIAHLGAKVLHPRAAEIAMKFNIPLIVRNTFTEDPGTEIVNASEAPGRRMTGVTHTGKLVSIQVDLKGVAEEHRRDFEARVYEMLAKYAINLHMITISPSGIGFAVPREQFLEVQDMFDGLVLPMQGADRAIYLVQASDVPSRCVEAQQKLLEPLGGATLVPLTITEGCTMVSLVGQNYMQQPGVFHAVLSTLHEAQIPVLQISDSDFSLSCMIPESELRRAVSLLHQRFGLDEAQ